MAPEAAEQELRSFAPHTLVHTDTAGLDRAALEGVPSWVEVGYSDSMNAWVYSGEYLAKHEDISTDILLGLVDEVAERLREHWAIPIHRNAWKGRSANLA